MVNGQPIGSPNSVSDNGLRAVGLTLAVIGCSLNGWPAVTPVGPKDPPYARVNYNISGMIKGLKLKEDLILRLVSMEGNSVNVRPRVTGPIQMLL